ncbi:lytic transglycosylase domain-containing protein [Novosphingobium sp. HR1a]|uniref:lytic transglycosylase domain-containing protein n=1 Tax=Novosphingobium sp. HR1a TaxID=1395637 RepID=UPI001B3C9662|nr:lytic transglycosylase domain-containing protein [Novosphingobium sp. HR1a]MBF7015773.1 lytic transglycosylase domain-containing protein [Novosphingobium sp. HR1a]MCC4254688.1 lytic transglycosylase domain-containing protein [Sphingobium naphthae]MEC7932072.1 lytic transglycosylase domain-containing protein [Pseudomonadota bacterium]
MTLPAAVVMGLAAQCAPDVAPETIAAIVKTESQGYELAININGLGHKVAQPTTLAQAISIARAYVAKGYSVDLGLGQINSRNMKALGLTWDTVFEPCTNIAAAGAVLAGNYRQVRNGLHPQRALRIALSMYNTGSQSRGFANGYVGRVVGNAGFATTAQPATVPSTAITSTADTATAATVLAALVEENTSDMGTPRAAPSPPPPSWDVFAKAEFERARLAGEGDNR